MGAGDLSEPPVRLDVVFDRFPASIRGALVVRGADPNPHQATVEEAFVADLSTPTRGAGPVGIEGSTVHVRPRGEVVIPFEVPFTDLASGWYLVSVTVSVDGQQRLTAADPAKRFVVAWPRELVRRGPVEVGEQIDVPGTPGVRVDRVECKSDRAVIRWTAPADAGVTDLRVHADGAPLVVLDPGGDGAERATIVYPVLRAHRTLRFQVDRRRLADGSVERGPWTTEVALT